MNDKLIAIVCSDIHLSDAVPSARAETREEWFDFQKNVLSEVSCICIDRGNVPLLIAGDLFHKWTCSPELISLAASYLPKSVLSIPGQHDLPQHNLNDMYRSAYGVLVHCGRITDLSHTFITIDNWTIVGFPFGKEIKGVELDGKKLALVHKFIWKDTNSSYQGVSTEEHVMEMVKKLNGFQLGIFGDNHYPFEQGDALYGKGVFNCGCLIPRRRQESDYPCRIGLLNDSGKITSHPLHSVKSAKWKGPGEIQEEFEDEDTVEQMIDKLEEEGEESPDFRPLVLNYIKKARGLFVGTKQIIMDALDNAE